MLSKTVLSGFAKTNKILFFIIQYKNIKSSTLQQICVSHLIHKIDVVGNISLCLYLKNDLFNEKIYDHFFFKFS